jgi:hypothetical protein
MVAALEALAVAAACLELGVAWCLAIGVLAGLLLALIR